MGIQERDSPPRFNILGNEIMKECRLACSGLTDTVQMVAPVVLRNPKKLRNNL